MRSIILCLLTVLSCTSAFASALEVEALFRSFALRNNIEAVLTQDQVDPLKAEIVNVARVYQERKWSLYKRIAAIMGFELPEIEATTSIFAMRLPAKAPTPDRIKEARCRSDSFAEDLGAMLADCGKNQLKGYLACLIKDIMIYDVLHVAIARAPANTWENAKFIPVLARETPPHQWKDLQDCYGALFAERFPQVLPHMFSKKASTKPIVFCAHNFLDYDTSAPAAQVKGWRDFLKAGWYIYSPWADYDAGFRVATPLLRLMTPRARLFAWATSPDFSAVLDPAKEMRIRHYSLSWGCWKAFRHGASGNKTPFKPFEYEFAKAGVEAPARVLMQEDQMRIMALELSKDNAEDKIEALRVKHQNIEKELNEKITSLEKQLRETSEALRSVKVELVKSQTNHSSLEKQLLGAAHERRDLEEKLRASRSRVTQLEGSLEEKQRALNTAGRELSELKNKEKTPDAEKKALEGRIVNLQLEIKTHRGDKQKQALEIEQLQKELKAVREEADKQQKEVLTLKRAEKSTADLERALSKLRGRLKEQGERLETLRKVEDELVQAKKTIERQQRELDEEMQDDDIHMQEQEKSIEQLRQMVMELEFSCGQLHEANLTLADDNTQLRHILQNDAEDGTMPVVVMGEVFPMTAEQIVNAARFHVYHTVILPRAMQDAKMQVIAKDKHE